MHPHAANRMRWREFEADTADLKLLGFRHSSLSKKRLLHLVEPPPPARPSSRDSGPSTRVQEAPASLVLGAERTPVCWGALAEAEDAFHPSGPNVRT